MGLRSRLGALVAMATLVLTPGVRLACLVLCAAPGGVAQAAGMTHAAGGAAVDRPTAAAAAHAHHHHPAATPVPAESATASLRATPEARCDTAPGSVCADADSVLPRPAPRVAAELAILASGPWRTVAADAPQRPAPPPIRVAPPGPPAASTPLRV